MKRWWLMVALLLSLGFNLGLLAAVAGGWWASRGEEGAAVAEEARAPERDERPEEAAPDGEPADDPEQDGVPSGSRELGWEGEAGVELPAGAPGTAGSRPADEGGHEGDDEDGDEGDEQAGDRPAGPRGGEPPAGDTGAEPGSGAAAGDPAAGGPEPHPPFEGRPGGPDAGPPDGPPLDRMADHLGLGGEVRERFLELQRRFVQNRFEIQRRGRVLTLEMHRELSSRRPDPERVEALIDHRADLWRQQEILTARTILETRSILEPEQQRRYLQVLRHLMAGPRDGRPGIRPGARLRGEGRIRPGFGPGPPAGPPPGEAPPGSDPPGEGPADPP